MTDFKNIIKDFTGDILLTFPEYKDKLSMDDLDFDKIKEYCKEVYPKHFFDIIYQNNEIFNETVYLLPNIDFKELWDQDISDKTRETIWKYLQLILFNIVEEVDKSKTFGDAAKLFEAIDEDELKNKLEECMTDMEELFSETENTEQFNKENLPDPDKIQDHISSMLDGKLGCLAKEIAEETAEDLNIDSIDNVQDIFKKLFSNPTKLMDLVRNVGGKLDSKMKSGDINETELMDEAKDLLGKMQNIPGMGNIHEMFSKMNNNPNMNQFKQKMQQAMDAEKMREKMKKRNDEKNANKKFTINNEHLEKTFRDKERVANEAMDELLREEDIKNINKGKKKKKKRRKKNKAA